MAVTVPQGTTGTVVNPTNWNVLVDRINASIDKDGTIGLTGNWDVGAYTITCTQLISDIAIGTAPLVVTSTTVVPNLNVDQVDGFDLDQALLIASSPQFAALTLGNEGLHLLDTNDSHDLVIKPGSDLTADRILTLTTGDAARTITLSGNPTLADWFDQAVKAASTPSFAGITVNNTGLHILDTGGDHDLIIKPGSDVGSDRTLTLTTGDSDRTITLSGNPTLNDWFDQAVKAASSPTFAGVTLNNTGLHLLDTGGDHDLIIAPGSDVGADRTLTLTTGDSDRTITLSGNPTLSDWFDQEVKAASSPTFAGVTLNNTGLHVLDTNASHDLIIKPGSDLTADRTLTITTDDQDRAVVLSNYAGIYVDDNAVATTILLVDAFEPIDVFDTDMPEAISSGAHGTNNITIGETAVYAVNMHFYAIAGGVNKVYDFYAFEIAASGDTITGATQANPCVVTAVGHSFSNGNLVKISGVAGMTELNGQIYTVTNKATDTFELEDDNGTDINSGAYGAYTSGGTAVLATQLTQVHVEQKFATQTDVASFSSSSLISLTSGNTLEAHVKGTTDATDITIVGGQFWMKRV